MQQGETPNETARRQQPYTTLRITNQGVDAGQRSKKNSSKYGSRPRKPKADFKEIPMWLWYAPMKVWLVIFWIVVCCRLEAWRIPCNALQRCQRMINRSAHWPVHSHRW